MTILQTPQMYSTRKEYQLLLGDQKKRKDRNVRLLAKLDNIEKKAAFLQAKTDRIRSLKGFYKSSTVPPVLGHRVSFHERVPTTPIDRPNDNYPYEYYRPRYYPPFREERLHDDSRTSYNVKNISLDEAIEEISRRFVLIPKTPGNIQPSNSKTSYVPEANVNLKDKYGLRSSDFDRSRRNLDDFLPPSTDIPPNAYSGVKSSSKYDTRDYLNETDQNFSDEENSQLSVKENTKKYSKEEISLEKEYVSDSDEHKNLVEVSKNIVSDDFKDVSKDCSILEKNVDEMEEVVSNTKISTNNEDLKEAIDDKQICEKPAFTLINNLSLDTPDISSVDNNIIATIDTSGVNEVECEDTKTDFIENLSDELLVKPSSEDQENPVSNPDVYSNEAQLSSEIVVTSEMTESYDPREDVGYNAEAVESHVEYAGYDPTLQESQNSEVFDDQSQQINNNQDAMGQEIPYDSTSNEYQTNYNEITQPDGQYATEGQYEQQPEYDPNQQYYYEGQNEPQPDNPNQQYDYNTNNTTAEEIALDNEGNSELNTFSEANNLNTDTQNLEYPIEESQNYVENPEIQNVDQYQGQEYQQENYNADETLATDSAYINNEEYPDQSQTYAPEAEYSENQEYDQTNNPVEYPSEEVAYRDNAYQENTAENQPYDETQYTEDGQNVQPLKVLESDTEVDVTAREEPSQLESDFDFSSQQ